MRLDMNYDETRAPSTIFNTFKKLHPELVRYGMQYKLCEVMTLRIWIPRVGVIRYEAIPDIIHWEQRWEDTKLLKQQERDIRPDMYQRFLSEIDIYQKETGMTQGQIAEMTGVSRRSINKYLSGVVTPKVSTMQKIAEKLNLDI